ncbi:MAG: hypothetical protein K2L90_06965 [Muribaculaceae bacterium]|nr:hypothetical protein [Muribaculaceae bacterium]
MKKMKLMAVIVCLCALFTACDSENKGNSIEQTMTNCFLRVTGGTEASSYLNTNVNCRLFFNLDEGVADVAISNFQPTASSAKATLELSGLPWSVNDKGYMVINQASAAAGAVTDLKMEFINRYVPSPASGSMMPAPILLMSFTYNGVYDIVLYQEQYLYLDNSTVVTTLEDGSEFKPKPNTQYVVTLNPQAMTATLFINGAQFAAQMKAVQMTFKDIPFSFVIGGYSLNSESLIPESAGTPYPQYEITDLLGHAYLDGNFSIGYTCGDKWRVNSALRYLSPSTTDKQ